MKPRYGVSPWVHTFPDSRRPDYPRLRGEHSADVVILGGGLTGCATAHACATAGLRPLVIEAARIGQGSVGRSSGLLLPEPGPSFKDISKTHGLRSARTMFEAWRRASLDAAALLRRLRIRCDLERQDSLLAGWSLDEKALRKEFEARTAAGLDARWLTGKPVRQASRLEATTAISVRDAFALDPYRACVGVAAAAAKRGARFFERSAAVKVRARQKDVEILLDGAVVHAGTVVVTTGTATAEFTPLRRHFKRRQSYLVLTEPLSAALRRQVIPDTLTLRDVKAPPHRLRVTSDGRLLVAGADQDEPPARTRDAVLRQRTGQLMYELLTMYPEISGLQPEYGWDLSYGDSVDGIPYIGAHRNYPHHLFALGGSRDSVTAAFLAARLLVRAVRGEAQKGDEVFGWTR